MIVFKVLKQNHITSLVVETFHVASSTTFECHRKFINEKASAIKNNGGATGRQVKEGP